MRGDVMLLPGSTLGLKAGFLSCLLPISASILVAYMPSSPRYALLSNLPQSFAFGTSISPLRV